MASENFFQAQDSYHILGRVEKFEDKLAVIATADNQKIYWPIKNLPNDCEVGSEIRLVLTTAKTAEVERQLLAKTILNQVLSQSDG